jgi:hypothetical protein
MNSHRQTHREQMEADALRRNREFAQYLLAVVMGCVLFFLVYIGRSV